MQVDCKAGIPVPGALSDAIALTLGQYKIVPLEVKCTLKGQVYAATLLTTIVEWLLASCLKGKPVYSSTGGMFGAFYKGSEK